MFIVMIDHTSNSIDNMFIVIDHTANSIDNMFILIIDLNI